MYQQFYKIFSLFFNAWNYPKLLHCIQYRGCITVQRLTCSVRGIVQFISRRSSPSSFKREFPSNFYEIETKENNHPLCQGAENSSKWSLIPISWLHPLLLVGAVPIQVYKISDTQASVSDLKVYTSGLKKSRKGPLKWINVLTLGLLHPLLQDCQEKPWFKYSPFPIFFTKLSVFNPDPALGFPQHLNIKIYKN